MAEQIEEVMDASERKALDAAKEAETARQAERTAEENARRVEEQRQDVLRAAEQLEGLALTLKAVSGERRERTSQIHQAISEQRDRFAETATAITPVSSTVHSQQRRAHVKRGRGGRSWASGFVLPFRVCRAWCRRR